MAKDWSDPSDIAKMFDNMDADYFRRRFVNPDTRDNWDLVVRRVVGPAGVPRYKILTISAISYLQRQIMTKPDKPKSS